MERAGQQNPYLIHTEVQHHEHEMRSGGPMCIQVEPSTEHSAVYIGFATRALAQAFCEANDITSQTTIIRMSQLGEQYEELATQTRRVLIFPTAEILTEYLNAPSKADFPLEDHVHTYL